MEPGLQDISYALLTLCLRHSQVPYPGHKAEHGPHHGAESCLENISKYVVQKFYKCRSRLSSFYNLATCSHAKNFEVMAGDKSIYNQCDIISYV